MFQTQQQLYSDVAELASTLEEANTRILLHATHASDNYSATSILFEESAFHFALAFQSNANSNTVY